MFNQDSELRKSSLVLLRRRALLKAGCGFSEQLGLILGNNLVDIFLSVRGFCLDIPLAKKSVVNHEEIVMYVGVPS